MNNFTESKNPVTLVLYIIARKDQEKWYFMMLFLLCLPLVLSGGWDVWRSREGCREIFTMTGTDFRTTWLLLSHFIWWTTGQAGSSEEKLNQYLVFSERRVSVVKAIWEFLVLKIQSANQSLGKMFVFLGLSFPTETCQPVKPNTCHRGGTMTGVFTWLGSGQILTKLQSSAQPSQLDFVWDIWLQTKTAEDTDCIRPAQ